ncbi:hypothetical protein [Pseudomonas sp. RA_35y_Pfl2_P32]|uniref:hypothetical protein n=1 Tax=Pseudomonas sp. RA_35y_Pfl2_P32 TaxID=3088705 RepID=UPI0030DA30AE
MHIEITYCQRNISTSEMTLPAENRQQKNGRTEDVATMTQAVIVKPVEHRFIARQEQATG